MLCGLTWRKSWLHYSDPHWNLSLSLSLSPRWITLSDRDRSISNAFSPRIQSEFPIVCGWIPHYYGFGVVQSMGVPLSHPFYFWIFHPQKPSSEQFWYPHDHGNHQDDDGYSKSPFWIGKSTINGVCSIANCWIARGYITTKKPTSQEYPINIPIDSLIMYHHDNPVAAILNYYLSGR